MSSLLQSTDILESNDGGPRILLGHNIEGDVVSAGS